MISVRLKPESEKRLRTAAKAAGKTVSSVVQNAIDKECAEILDVQTLDVTWADVIGAYASKEPTDASKIEEEFGRILNEKGKANRL